MAESPWQFEEVPCDYCGSRDADLLVTGRDRLHGLSGEVRVVVCCQCGLARTSPRPTVESLGTAYPEDYAPHKDKGERADAPRGLLRWALVNLRGYPLGRRTPAAFRWLLAPLGAAALAGRHAAGYLPYSGEARLLDFGCGAGGYVAKMAAAGWKAEGLDASPNAVRRGREAGLTLHQGTLPGAALEPGSFDVVTMWQALEHVPSPKATLEAVRRLLRPGGRLLVVCPEMDDRACRRFGAAWFPFDLPRHLTHFTATTLRRHLEAAGFEVEWLRPVRRPSLLRRSYGYLATETGKRFHRGMARSRLVAGLLSWALLLAGWTGQMMCLARRKE